MKRHRRVLRSTDMPRVTLLRSSIAAALMASVLVACGGIDHAPRPSGFGDDPDTFPIDGGGSDGFGFDVPSTDAAINCAAGRDGGLCACKEIDQIPPTLYVLLDRSGSMGDKVPPSTITKWDQVRLALVDAKTGALRALGGRISVGMALFPTQRANNCAAGSEVLPVTVGSTMIYDRIGFILTSATPGGSTPTASSIEVLIAKLEALPKPAYLLLATDGAPNCGSTPCSADRCEYDIDGATYTDSSGTTHPCEPPFNCCDASVVGGGNGWQACLDSEASRAAVAELAAHDVKTFVLGVPGIGPYGSELDTLAIAGGEAQPEGSPARYYAASDGASLQAALSAIAAKVVDSCVIALDAAPDDPGITNVLLDGDLIAQNATDGWTWQDPSHIELHGAACNRIHAGVARVQVAVGCKTITK